VVSATDVACSLATYVATQYTNAGLVGGWALATTGRASGDRQMQLGNFSVSLAVGFRKFEVRSLKFEVRRT